jgi:alpha-1,3-rhamnosyltransferase
VAIEIKTFPPQDQLSERERDRRSAKSVTLSEPTGSEGSTVSVLVPSHNHGRFVARCLRSIIEQTHRPLQLIVIDDGSQDDSLQQIEHELKECPFDSELIAGIHKGLVSALNEGLKRSRGKYFAYLGSDDIWLPGFLASRVKLLNSRPNAVLAYGHSYVINKDNQIVECTNDWAPYRDGCVREMLLHHVVPFSPSVLYRREILERHRWSEEAGLEDYDLYLRLSSEGEFALDNEILCAWRSHDDNKSRNLEFMLTECLEAQRRAANCLNLSSDELEKAHSRLRWRYASDFVRTGEKRKALKLVCSNLKGASSLGSVARMVVALTLPQPVLRWRRRVLERRAIRSYGLV